MHLYDQGGNKESKTNPDLVISQCDEFQSIDALRLNLIDTLNPNLLCYIHENDCNNTHKYDLVKEFLREDKKFMVEVINDIVEPVNSTKVRVLCNIGQEKLDPMNTLTNKSWKVNT